MVKAKLASPPTLATKSTRRVIRPRVSVARQRQDTDDFVLAHPQDCKFYSLETPIKGSGAPREDSFLRARCISFDEPKPASSHPCLKHPTPAIAHRLAMRPRTIPSSVVRALGVNLYDDIEAEANAPPTAFVTREAKYGKGFETPSTTEITIVSPPSLHSKCDDYVENHRPVPPSLFLPDDF